MRLTSRQLYYLFLAAAVVFVLLGCKKQVKPEQKWRTHDDKPLELQRHELRDLEDEDLEDLPEATVEEEDERTDSKL